MKKLVLDLSRALKHSLKQLKFLENFGGVFTEFYLKQKVQSNRYSIINIYQFHYILENLLSGQSRMVCCSELDTA